MAEWPAEEQKIRGLYDLAEITEKALEETRAKFPTRAELAAQLHRVRAAWPALADKLRAHLIPSADLRAMLVAVGAPAESVDIGISPERLRASHRQACGIRRRYTVLDLAERCGLLPA